MLTISDFSRVLSRSGTSLTLIGGQAVGWWAPRYAAVVPPDIPSSVTSRDIDFWADRGEAEELAAKTEDSSNDRRRLINFLEQRWARLT